MLTRIKPLLLASPLGWALACGPAPAPLVDRVDLNLEVENGVSLNGTSFGGYALQSAGTSFFDPVGGGGLFPTWDPPTLDPVGGGFGDIGDPLDPYSGIGVNGRTFDGIQSDDLRGVTLDTGVQVEDLLGAELQGRTREGAPTTLQVTGIAAGQGANADLLYYAVSAQQGMDWEPLCGRGPNGEPIPALAIPGAWNLDVGVNGGAWSNDGESLSFACRGSSIAKCMEAGFKPWIDPLSKDGKIVALQKDRVNEANHLQACVRMLRADYCGDGVAHTVDGRTIEFWDSMAMHHREMGSWDFEAAWSPNGAACMTQPRVAFPGGVVPSCVQQLSSSAAACQPSKLSDGTKKQKYLYNSFESQLQR